MLLVKHNSRLFEVWNLYWLLSISQEQKSQVFCTLRKQFFTWKRISFSISLCLKITKNVAFDIFIFGISTIFGLLKLTCLVALFGCNLARFASQSWMRLFLWFSNNVLWEPLWPEKSVDFFHRKLKLMMLRFSIKCLQMCGATFCRSLSGHKDVS